MRQLENEEIGSLAGLNQRSPLLAAAMAMAMVSLAGIPPLAGFFGKFLLLKSVLEQAGRDPGYYYLAFITIAGVAISMYYYFGVIRAIYWSKETPDLTPIRIGWPLQAATYACMIGMLYLGVFPNRILNAASRASSVLQPVATQVAAEPRRGD
jgi:NADH-quinone oxidoreductase subunit N